MEALGLSPLRSQAGRAEGFQPGEDEQENSKAGQVGRGPGRPCESGGAART